MNIITISGTDRMVATNELNMLKIYNILYVDILYTQFTMKKFASFAGK